MFSDDELDEARAVSVIEIAERHGARLKRRGRELVGPCPVCGGREDKFAIKPSENVWHCRGIQKGGGALDLEMHLSGCSFPEAVRKQIGEDAGTPTRRPPTPEEIAAREAREAQRRREEAEDRARKEMSAARIVACLQPVAGTPGETYLRDVRRIDVNHWAIKRALEDVATLGWCERVYFKQEDPDKPHHELNGQWLSAIIGILTDPVTTEPTGGITPDVRPPGTKDRQSHVARRRRAAGDYPLVARRRGSYRPAHRRRTRDRAVGDDDGLQLLPDVGDGVDSDNEVVPGPRRNRLPDDHRR